MSRKHWNNAQRVSKPSGPRRRSSLKGRIATGGPRNARFISRVRPEPEDGI